MYTFILIVVVIAIIISALVAVEMFKSGSFTSGIMVALAVAGMSAILFNLLIKMF